MEPQARYRCITYKDKLLTIVILGELVEVGFTVLQHGQASLEGLSPTLRWICSK